MWVDRGPGGCTGQQAGALGVTGAVGTGVAPCPSAAAVGLRSFPAALRFSVSSQLVRTPALRFSAGVFSLLHKAVGVNLGHGKETWE